MAQGRVAARHRRTPLSCGAFSCAVAYTGQASALGLRNAEFKCSNLRAREILIIVYAGQGSALRGTADPLLDAASYGVVGCCSPGLGTRGQGRPGLSLTRITLAAAFIGPGPSLPTLTSSLGRWLVTAGPPAWPGLEVTRL